MEIGSEIIILLCHFFFCQVFLPNGDVVYAQVERRGSTSGFINVWAVASGSAFNNTEGEEEMQPECNSNKLHSCSLPHILFLPLPARTIFQPNVYPDLCLMWITICLLLCVCVCVGGGVVVSKLECSNGKGGYVINFLPFRVAVAQQGKLVAATTWTEYIVYVW